MKNAKITYANGDTITTGINGTNEEIKKYFKVGKLFNIGANGSDNMQAVVKCDILPHFESGATTHATNDLILFADNTRQTSDLANGIYEDWALCGIFGTRPLWEKFLPLFESARRHYINEFQMKGAGHIINMSIDEIKEFCQLYVDDFENWKQENA